MALNRPTEFGVHVRGARRNGLSEEEIREAIVHSAVYCGVPSGVDGMKIAERIFEETYQRVVPHHYAKLKEYASFSSETYGEMLPPFVNRYIFRLLLSI